MSAPADAANTTDDGLIGDTEASVTWTSGDDLAQHLRVDEDVVPILSYVVICTGFTAASVILLSDLVAVGSLEWMALINEERDDDAGTIRMVYVDPSHRRRGVATLLMRIAMEEARARGWTLPRHSDPEEITDDGKAWVAAGAR